MEAAKPRRIFREKALQHYLSGREKTVLPRLVRPKVFIYLWVLAALLIASLLIAWSWQLPAYRYGWSVSLPTSATRQIVLLPLAADQLGQIRLNQTVVVYSSNPARPHHATVTAMLPTLLSKSDIGSRYGVSPATLPEFTTPLAVVEVAISEGEPSLAYSGRIATAQLQIGTQPVIALVPGLNWLVGKDK